LAGVLITEEVTLPSLIQHLTRDFCTYLQEVLARQNRFTWVLSGGHTPRQFFEALADEPYRSTLPWSKIWIFWGDERPVPPTHAESNFRMAQDALLQHVPIPINQIFRMQGELPPAEAARDYENQLRFVFGSSIAWPVFDLILLGMGPDGHTASLFPGTQALAERQRWVVDNAVPALNTTRLTLTLPVLNHAQRVWFLVTGIEKADVFLKVQAAADARYPASLIKPVSGHLHWYVDASLRRHPGVSPGPH